MTNPQTRVVNVWKRLAWAVLLGAVTTVAVAWLPTVAPVDRWLGTSFSKQTQDVFVIESSALSGPGLMVTFGEAGGALEDRILVAATNMEAPWNRAKAAEQLAQYQIKILERPPIDEELIRDLPDRAMFTEERVGWPWRALTSRAFGTPVTLKSGVTLSGTYGLIDCGKPSPWMPRTQLPIRPLWWGLVGNVIVWSGVWFLLLMLPRLARAIEWWWKGMCPACGYSLRGVREAGCPECGYGRQREAGAAASS
jgi:hypothetical protein